MREQFEAWLLKQREETPQQSPLLGDAYQAGYAAARAEAAAEIEALRKRVQAQDAALDFAAGFIGDVIYNEFTDVDGDAGDRILHIITEAKERGEFDKAKYGDLEHLCPFERAERAEQRVQELEAERQEQIDVITGVEQITCRNGKQHEREEACLYCRAERAEAELAAARELLREARSALIRLNGCYPLPTESSAWLRSTLNGIDAHLKEQG